MIAVRGPYPLPGCGRVALFVAVTGVLVGCTSDEGPAALSPDVPGTPHVVVVDSGVVEGLPILQPYGVRQVGGGAHGAHGTMMLSVVLGIMGPDPLEPGSVDVTSVVVPQDAAEGGLADAIGQALDADPDVISVSMGVRRGTPALDAAVRRAREAGVVVVAAAGNVRFLAPDYPARYDGVIAVGAVDARGETWSGSAQDGLDVLAPGVDVAVLNPDGTTSRETGTSVAAAAVTHQILRQLVDGVIDDAEEFVPQLHG